MTQGAEAKRAHDHAGGGVAPGEAPFYIPATSTTSRPRRTVKHNDTFVVLDTHGDIGATGGSPDGLFHADTRYLSHLELLINGTQPLLLGSAVRDDNLSFGVDLTNPDLYADGSIILMKDTVHIARTIYLCDGSLRERVALSNHGAETIQFTISVAFSSDFADIFEVRGVARSKRGRAWTKVGPPDHVSLFYQGLDGVTREAALSFEPAPTALFEGLARYDVTLAPGEHRTIFVVASSRGRVPSMLSFFKGLATLHRMQKATKREAATVETSNRVLEEILYRSSSDLYMLVTATEDGPYPYAGIPWYSTSFGRDGIITALQMLWADPSLARGVLARLARLQARTVDRHADAEPGKILHEMRGGEMAATQEVPFALYYGSVDATPLFVMLAGAYFERTGDVEVIRGLWPALERALGWIDTALAADPRGFLSYARAETTGLANQGWKDSYDSVFHADGRLAEGPISLVEVQGYVFAAFKAAAVCARALGLADIAQAREAQAEAMRLRFEEAFWSPEIGSYALALDGQGERCLVRTSNAGHVLATGIAAPGRAHRIVADLLRPDFFSGWGIRTVASGEPRYNPMSYHNGSIWPHDNALIAQGMARYGRKACIAAVFEAMMRAVVYMDHRRIPELYCGFRRRLGRGPTLYPAACSPQAWASGAPFHMLQALLGLEFDSAARQIRLVQPSVPAFVGDITIRNLRLGDASVDFVVRQHGEAISIQVLRVSGDLQVSLLFDSRRGEAPPAERDAGTASDLQR